MKTYLFTSKRLGFRNWIESDKKPFSKMNANKNVMRYFPDTLSQEKSDALVIRLQNHYHKFGYTFYAVDELESQKFIGFIGIVNSTFDAYFTPCKEIGWRLQQESWGKGFATEGEKRCLEVAFEVLNFKSIYAITTPKNWPSEHVMQKIGMQKNGLFEHPKIKDGHWLKTELSYKISIP